MKKVILASILAIIMMTSVLSGCFGCGNDDKSDVSENGEGVALINDCKYGISLENSTMGLSLLRATQRPDIFSDRQYHEFSYCILPHGDDVSVADIMRFAWEYNVPLIGEGEAENLFSIDSDNVFLQAVKKAENSDDIVIRLVEQIGKRGFAELELPFEVTSAKAADLLENECVGAVEVVGKNKIRFEYKPFEIVTISLDERK